MTDKEKINTMFYLIGYVQGKLHIIDDYLEYDFEAKEQAHIMTHLKATIDKIDDFMNIEIKKWEKD